MSLIRGLEDILRELTESEVKELKELYLDKYGTHNYHYLLMYNQCKWNDQLKNVVDPDSNKWQALRKKFFTYRNTDFHISGTYICLHFDLVQSVFFNTWQDDGKELFECLEKTQLIDWQNGPLLTVDKKFCEIAKRIAAIKGVQVEHAPTCCFLALKHEDALNLEYASLPEAYFMAPLKNEVIPFIHDLWPNKREGSLEFLQGLLVLNKHLGIYRVEDGKLLAWVFQNEFSGIGVLETVPEMQRQGFASKLTATLSRQIAEEEDIAVSAWIKKDNSRSAGLMAKIGFQNHVDIEWIHLMKNK